MKTTPNNIFLNFKEKITSFLKDPLFLSRWVDPYYPRRETTRISVAAPQHRDGSGPAGPSSGARDVVLSRAVKAGGGEVDAGDGEGGGDRGLVVNVVSPAEGLAAGCDAAGVAKACRELGPRLACWKS